MENNKVIKRIQYAVKIKLVSPLCIASGYSEITDKDVQRNAEGEVFIPGSSLAGAMRQYLEEHMKEHIRIALENEILDKVTENMEVEINEEIIHDEIHRMLHQYEEQLSMQGITLEQYLQFTKSTRADLEKMMAPEAEAHVKTRYLLEAVADAENIEVSDEEAKAEAKKVAEMYQVTEEDFINMIGGLEVMKYDCKMKKAMEFLKEN